MTESVTQKICRKWPQIGIEKGKLLGIADGEKSSQKPHDDRDKFYNTI